ncbi:GNAT family N-acetyltransferase [Paenibacillus aurantiacus]|uniref:GNAT family N-acetyltransferase n=1 Tax=Paenibacillus aurantiacus TaxID=1936118 RepID=A0ABV5KZ09_9BACL
MTIAISDMRLETKRLLIRPYDERDFMESFHLMQDPALFAYLHMNVMTIEEYRGLFDWLTDSYQTPIDAPFKYSFAVRRWSDDALLGWCGVGELDFSAPDKELYYLIGREHWGSGYATEAASALAAYAFEVIGLGRLHAKADPRNSASRKVLEKVGFRFGRVLEGLSGDDADCNGEWMYAMTRDQLRGGELADARE